MKKSYLLAFFACSLLAACVVAPAPGAREGVVPPRLVLKDNVKVWDNAGNFGPVPVALQEKGAATCATLNTRDAKYTATGFHSRAMDLDGKPFVDGGYYCVRR